MHPMAEFTVPFAGGFHLSLRDGHQSWTISMPNREWRGREWRGNIIGTSNFFVRELAAALPNVISVLLRIALVYLFFWYLFDFICELGCEYLRFAILLGLAALVALLVLCWKLVNSWTNFDLNKVLPSDGLLPFCFS